MEKSQLSRPHIWDDQQDGSALMVIAKLTDGGNHPIDGFTGRLRLKEMSLFIHLLRSYYTKCKGSCYFSIFKETEVS